MKRILSLGLVFIMILTLCSCGISKKALVVDNNGKTEKITAKELASLARENDALFNKQYRGATISFGGTVKSVDTWLYVNGSTIPVDIITFKEGWEVVLYHNGIYGVDVASLRAGQKLGVESNIYDAWIKVNVRGCDKYGGYSQDSLQKTKIYYLNSKT